MMIKPYTYAISAILLASTLIPLTAGAYYQPYNAQLYIPGMGNQTAPAPTYTIPPIKPVHLNFDVFGNPEANTSGTSTSSSKSSGLFSGLFGASSNSAQDANGNQITLVSADNTNVYAIIGGKKHLIPSVPEILAEYNYKSDLVQTVTFAQLSKYPRASLIMAKGDTKHIYYLTGAGMLRLMPSEKVIDSYGNRKEDAITIGRIEFNFYPQNQYIYLENPLNRDVFQIVSGGKRYLTPMAVQRLGITIDQVAPVNQTEMDSYKILAPVVQ